MKKENVLVYAITFEADMSVESDNVISSIRGRTDLSPAQELRLLGSAIEQALDRARTIAQGNAFPPGTMNKLMRGH